MPSPTVGDAPPLLIGVDAGGTKTLATIAQPGERGLFCVLGQGLAGSGNPLSAGVPQAVDAIGSAIRDARASAGIGAAPAQVAVIAVAGAANDAVRKEVAWQAERAGFAERCTIESDATPLLAVAAPEGPCVGLISGTGSVAIARNADGEILRRGGWGYLLGDEGSGYAIGRATLRAVLGQTAGEELVRAACRAIGADTPADLPRTVHQSPQPHRLVASSARCALELAAAGEPSAKAIAEQAAAALAGLLKEAEQAAGIAGGSHPVVVSGSVLLGSRLLRETVCRLAGVSTERLRQAHDATVGCLRIAATRLETS
ncbi:BadF/BadG/BcrA/BcrD ATPase family protein [Pseudobythopirellula maris]|uniref:BadF/BadG/BcrA/BcrD ATPase family protein n=1 Tax=Pseudobythopirellula maris TaxID=2527991 RepID=A0A5C5ZIK2_9BACT|nr:BadF/BadG/BcrA/BcrD ATPase family protein [Pseudobythopirellula maris]TWT87229.1 BadF/BadG/BcrA/BcrD ATPase family protein [Pseudobythopirellula maris]